MVEQNISGQSGQVDPVKRKLFLVFSFIWPKIQKNIYNLSNYFKILKYFCMDFTTSL